jgi:hypothetical protein
MHTTLHGLLSLANSAPKPFRMTESVWWWNSKAKYFQMEDQPRKQAMLSALSSNANGLSWRDAV